MGKKNELNGFLGPGTHYEGKLIFEGTFRIDGEFEGEIESSGILIVGDKARLKGTINVEEIFVSGEIVGTVHAAKKATFYKTAILKGELATTLLVVEEGAKFLAKVKMLDQELEESSKKTSTE